MRIIRIVFVIGMLLACMLGHAQYARLYTTQNGLKSSALYTAQTILQTLKHVSSTNNSVELCIYSLSYGTYRVDIFLANNEDNKGFFEIERFFII